MDRNKKERIEDDLKKIKQENFLGVAEIKVSDSDLDKFKKFVFETETNFPTISEYYMKLKKGYLVCDTSSYYHGIKIEEDKKITIKKMGVKLKDEYLEVTELSDKINKVLEISNLNSIVSSMFGYTRHYSNEVDERFKIEKDKQEFFDKFKPHLKKEENNYLEIHDGNPEGFFKAFFNYDCESEEEQKREENLKCGEIFKVLEKDNMRFVLIKGSFNNNKFLVCNPDYELYNYMDEKRKILLNYRNNFIFDEETKAEDIDTFENEVNLSQFPNHFNYLSKEDFKKFVSSAKSKKRMEEVKRSQEEALTNKIRGEIEEKGEVVLNGIKRLKNGFFEYQNQKIGYETYNIFQIAEEEKDFEEIFNRVAHNYTSQFQSGYDGWNNQKLFCGSFKVKTEEIGNFNYIENIRINKKEVEEVLKRAICYQKKEDYVKFLEEVSYCSIKIHNILANGLRYDLKNKGYWDRGGAVWTKINVIRKKNKHFLKDGETEYSISDLNSLISLQNAQEFNSHIFIKKLLVHTSINSEEKALLLIKSGLKEYKDSLKRAKLLLKETIKALNISEVTIESEEHNGKGYVVKGKSGNQYFVTDSLKVYEYPKMRYICIINKSGNNLCNNDLLVSRLYALANDQEMKTHIYTLNK